LLHVNWPCAHCVFSFSE